MLDVLNILNGLFLIGVVASDITLYSDADYIHNEPENRDIVTAISMHREWWRDDSKCKYQGVMVPFVRDWPVVIKHKDFETVNPPEPNKTAGQAFIINRKVCPGKPDEAMFRVADGWRNSGRLLEKWHFAAQDLYGMREEYRPKWLPQVLARIERVAQHDAQAKAFLDFTTAATKAKTAEASNGPSNTTATAIGSVPGGGKPEAPTTKTMLPTK
ncbi:hypothetical protein [Laribacter hongkongensis]|uniref:hypothetical protein n=1 Tax=Laribacter hongkongensis TaxID=168471 RepID=UPI001EFE1F16|nr:hypothetical protein [Laribacter hongkongensis]MCG9082359.1 hypothetical protein [Laribacter hongkongensis]MCG9096949.1 hypothetical protein [Laribacter hongkongensis]